MKFTIDKQTREDLNLRNKYNSRSIYSLFNQTVTTGGEKLLESLFDHPLSDPADINSRSAGIRVFQQRGLRFPWSAEAIGMFENYLAVKGNSNLLLSFFESSRKKLVGMALHGQEYTLLQQGIAATSEILLVLWEFVRVNRSELASAGFATAVNLINELVEGDRLDGLHLTGTELSTLETARYDYRLRYGLFTELHAILDFIYQLDVYTAAGQVAAENGFSYATALPGQDNRLVAKDMRHPAIKDAVGNDVIFDSSRNVMFLTGANMAGKSTFMKAFGINLYLAHMGFPVAADDMKFAVMDGIYTSINVPDDLSMGYSHFYAEVLRVKRAAEEVSKGKRMAVIFDELFKGTNVKDAYDGTLAITEAFSHYRNCFFIISTHIIEVGEALQPKAANLQFAFLPTIMEGTKPHYPYKLEEGITADRHGMVIIENEKIIELILS